MVLLKAALTNCKKRVLMTVFTVFEMTAAIIVFAVTVSSILIRYSYYEPFKDMLEGKGFFFYSNNGMNALALDPNYPADEFQMVPDSNLLSSHYLKSQDKTVGGYLQYGGKIAACNKVKADAAFNGKYYNNVLGYNDELIQRFKPKIKEGRWLSTSQNTDFLEAVVVSGDYDCRIGGKIELSYICTDENHSKESGYNPMRSCYAEVVGIIEDGARVFGITSNESSPDCNMMYSPYGTEIEKSPLVLISSVYIGNNYFEGSLDNPDDILIMQDVTEGLIQYFDSATDEQIDEEKEKINLMFRPSGKIFDFNVMNKNSKEYILDQVYILLPIMIVILVLIVVSSISNTALTTRDRLRDYSIYYITGLQWKHCTLINLIQSALTSVLALLLSAVALCIIRLTPIADTVTIIPHLWTFSAVAALILLYILISMIMPVIIIGKSTPKEILAK